MENKQNDTKEQKFYKALQDVFIGAQVEGKGGFVNLMKIKSNYYRKIENTLKNDIESALQSYPDFRDELFDKLIHSLAVIFRKVALFISIQPHSITTFTKRSIQTTKTLSYSGKHRCFTMLKQTEYSEAWMWM